MKIDKPSKKKEGGKPFNYTALESDLKRRGLPLDRERNWKEKKKRNGEKKAASASSSRPKHTERRFHPLSLAA